MKTYCLQSQITQEYVTERGRDQFKFTNWNSNASEIMTFETFEEADQYLEDNEMWACQVVETPERLIADMKEEDSDFYAENYFEL